MRSFISSIVCWILKEEGMAWSCGMDVEQEKYKKYACILARKLKREDTSQKTQA
jgi:hypothetical protein